MKTAVLYTNSKGESVSHSSYSSRQAFRQCPRQFALTRIQGWQDKERRAAPLFGKAIEAAVQHYEENGRQANSAVEKFDALWQQVQTLPEFPELKYTDSEKDWASLHRAGKEMAKLYEIRAPFLPISTNPKALWQQKVRKTIFPGTELEVLNNVAILDILSFPRWNHPMLPKLEGMAAFEEANKQAAEKGEPPIPYPAPLKGERRELIIDMKTSGDDLATDLIALDPQLAEYAWQTRIPDIAFLWFVKHSHSKKKWSRVTLLEDTNRWRAGFELFIIAEGTDPGPAWFVAEAAGVSEYESAMKQLPRSGKVRQAGEEAWLVKALADGLTALVSESGITKQRLQFAAVRLTEQDMDEIGRDVAQTTVEMVRAHKEQYYPKLAGVRFPNQKCNFCAMRWICLNDSDGRDKHLMRKGEEWLEGMED